MKLIIKPSDLIKRFIWDKYQHFCLKGKTYKEIDSIILEDKEFQISEEDAFVIGLTNVLYTDHVVYKFKQHLKEILENKSFDNKEEIENDDDDDDEIYHAVKLMVSKQLMIDSANDFLNKIPKVWDITKESNIFQNEINQITDLTKIFIEKINKLPVTIIQNWPSIKYVSAKKTINKWIK